MPIGDLSSVFDAAIAEGAEEEGPRFNIAPTDPMLVVRATRDGRGRELVRMKWGLVPFYADDPHVASRHFNARVETLEKRGPYREAFLKRRCLVLADGFYEWKHEGKKKLPHRVEVPGGGPFAMAGLWERWHPRDPHAGPPLESCTIITRDAAEPVRALHDRMPVVLAKAGYDEWLDREQHDPRILHAILAEHARTDLVVTRIDAVPLDRPKAQLGLF